MGPGSFPYQLGTSLLALHPWLTLTLAFHGKSGCQFRLRGFVVVVCFCLWYRLCFVAQTGLQISSCCHSFSGAGIFKRASPMPCGIDLHDKSSKSKLPLMITQTWVQRLLTNGMFTLELASPKPDASFSPLSHKLIPPPYSNFWILAFQLFYPH